MKRKYGRKGGNWIGCFRNFALFWNAVTDCIRFCIVLSQSKKSRKEQHIKRARCTHLACIHAYSSSLSNSYHAVSIHFFLYFLTVLKSTNEILFISATSWITRRMATSDAKRNVTKPIIIKNNCRYVHREYQNNFYVDFEWNLMWYNTLFWWMRISCSKNAHKRRRLDRNRRLYAGFLYCLALKKQ